MSIAQRTNMCVGPVLFTNIPTAYTEPQGIFTARKLPCGSHLPEGLGWDYSNCWSDAYKDFGLCQLSLPSTVQVSGLQAAILLSRTESSTRVGSRCSWADTQRAREPLQHAVLTSTEVTTETSTKGI